MRRRRLALAALALLACGPQTRPTRAPAAGPAGEPAAPLPDPENHPTNRAPGEVVELTIPRVDGSGLELRALRGRVVVIELTATWVTTWPETYAFYNRLLDEHDPSQLAVVVIALDDERAALSPEPAVRNPGFTLGWDPQGAVAARLQAAALPTVVILDRRGAVVHAQGGAPEGATQTLRDALREALAAP